MAAKKTEPAEKTVEPTVPTPGSEELPYNPATDPNKTAQERLDALTEQHKAMRGEPKGEYPL